VGFTRLAADLAGLAIGANTTIFSLAKQLLYERLAVPPGRVAAAGLDRNQKHAPSIISGATTMDGNPGG
jgi:hypothetical protein